MYNERYKYLHFIQRLIDHCNFYAVKTNSDIQYIILYKICKILIILLHKFTYI